MYNDENNQYNPRPRFDPKTGERIHYDDENTAGTTQTESSEYRYSAGNIPFEQENNNTSYYQQSSTFQQDTSYQQAGAGQGSMNQQNGRQKKKKDRNKDGFGERLAKLAGSAAVFGVIAGAVMYGVYYTGSTILPVKSSSDYNNIATVTSNVTATTAQSTASSSTGMDVQSVANAALPAMVALNGTTTVSSGSSSSFYGLFGGSQSYEAQTSGTGIIVGKNDKELLVVTNAHVVEDVNDLKCVFVDGESVSATVKGSKSDKDIAVVAINLSDIKDSTINSIAIAELADSDEIYAHTLHPYSQALLASVPIPDPDKEAQKESSVLSGDVPSPINPKPGCPFANRCKHATERCKTESPKLQEVRPGHFVACHLHK